MINLYNGDSYNILKSMDSKSVDLIVTDPPYELSSTDGGGRLIGYQNYKIHYRVSWI